MCWICRMKWHTIWKMMDRLVRKQILEWMMTASNHMSRMSTVRGLKIFYVLQLLWNLQKSHDLQLNSHENWFKRISNWIWLVSSETQFLHFNLLRCLEKPKHGNVMILWWKSFHYSFDVNSFHLMSIIYIFVPAIV